MNNMTQRRFTPQNIDELDKYGVFVFGSNLHGNHAGGAARTAVEKFGAIPAQAEGIQGKSYAIPTLDKNMNPLPVEHIRTSVERLYRYADEHPELDFYVTRIGCGIAGFREEDIAAIFKSFDFTPFNVILPMEFAAIRGVKGFAKGMKCTAGGNTKIYRENTEFSEPEAIACETGMHFVENPLEVFKYYKFDAKSGSEYAAVTGSGTIATHDSDSKIAVTRLSIGLKISFAQILHSGLSFALKKTGFIRERLLQRGKRQDNNTLAGQDYNTLAGQDYNVIACRYDSVVEMSGTGNIAIGANRTRMKGKKGNAICLAEFNDGKIIHVKAAIIDGITLKEDVFYTLQDGAFKEVDE